MAKPELITKEEVIEIVQNFGSWKGYAVVETSGEGERAGLHIPVTVTWDDLGVGASGRSSFDVLVKLVGDYAVKKGLTDDNGRTHVRFRKETPNDEIQTNDKG